MDIEKAKRITGWMSEGELLWLAELAARSSTIVEIGSWRGRSTRALGDHIGEHVYAVDTWKGDSDAHKKLERDHIKWNVLTATEDYDKNGEKVFEGFKENLSDLIMDGK